MGDVIFKTPEKENRLNIPLGFIALHGIASISATATMAEPSEGRKAAAGVTMDVAAAAR